ncbi:MAG: ThiF family adenylyltransferase [Acidobacteriia bacterium]|nr:ThiF family adenylyltransferase [Terriglobia bacterium]
MRLHVSAPLLKRVEDHLRHRKTEQVVFLLLAPAPNGLNVFDIYPVPPDELVSESRLHAEVSEEAQAKIIKVVADRKLLLGEIHSHPGCRQDTGFSPSDLAGFDDFVPHIFWRLRAKQYVALVFGDNDFDALAWQDDPKTPLPVDALVVDGKELRPTGITVRELERRKRERERYSRQVAMFGKEGQRRLAAASVAVVGVGGLGCHVIQQLGFAGVKMFFLVDPDRVDRSNLNRFVIATEADLGRLKVDVAREYINRVQPDAEVITVADSFLSAAAFDGLAKAGFVFGCLDNDGPRLVLLELCCAQQKPYLDLATVAGATCSRRVIPEQVITNLGCNRYPAGVSISPRIRAAGRLSTPSIYLKDCALASIAKEPHPAYRLPSRVPHSFNLLDFADVPAAFGCDLTVPGIRDLDARQRVSISGRDGRTRRTGKTREHCASVSRSVVTRRSNHHEQKNN